MENHQTLHCKWNSIWVSQPQVTGNVGGLFRIPFPSYTRISTAYAAFNPSETVAVSVTIVIASEIRRVWNSNNNRDKLAIKCIIFGTINNLCTLYFRFWLNFKGCFKIYRNLYLICTIVDNRPSTCITIIRSTRFAPFALTLLITLLL